MFSLRCGVGLVNVIVIMIVASITLSITLTNTLDAIITNGLAHVLSILGTAEAAVGTTFDGLFSQLDAVSDTLSEKDWPFPSSGTPSSTYADWRDRLLQLYLTGPSHFVVVYFSDESLLFVQDDSALSNVVAFDGIVATPFPQSANVSSFTKGMTVSTTLTEASWYFNRTDGTMMTTYPGPATPNANFNLAAFTGPTWLYDQVAGPQAQAKSAKTLMGNFIVRRRNSAVVSIMAMSNFRRPVDQGSTYPFGIAFAGITLDQLSNYLFAVLDSSDSLAYCIDSAGVIVAASSAAVTPFYSGPTAYPSGSTLPQNCETSSTLDQTLVHNDTFVACRLALSQSGHPAVSEVGVGWVVASTTARAKQVTVSGSNYFAAALKLQLRYDGVELFLLLVIPESDVIGNVVQGRNIAIGVTCAAFVVVAVLSFIVTSWLLKPLTRIAERMSMAARLEDDNGKETLSWMREVYDLQLAYYEMNEELNRVRSFVPQAVLQHDNAQIDDSSTQTPHRKDAPNKRKKASAGQIPLAEATEAARRMSNSGGSKSISDISRTRVVDLHCTLNTNVVTVMTINLSHFHREAFALPPKQVVAGLSDIVGVVTQEVTSRGGVLSLFHGDHFVVAFNGSKRCDRHARMAILAAVSIRDEINNQAHASRGPLRLRCPVRVGVATGTCLVGPVGNTTVKTFATIGPCVVQSNMLQRVVNQYGAGSSVLVTKRAAIEAGGKFELVYVDVVNLPTRTGVEPVPIAAVVSVASNTEGLHASENEFIQAVRHRNWRIEGNEEPASVSRSTTGLYVDTTDKGSVDKHSSKTAASSRDGPNTSRSNETITSPPFFVNPDDTTPLAEADGGSVLGLVPPPSRSPRGKADNKFGPEQQRSLAATIEAKWDIISRIEPLLDGHGYIGTDPETKVMVSNSLGAYFALCAMS